MMRTAGLVVILVTVACGGDDAPTDGGTSRCTSGATRCSANAAAVETCTDGVWFSTAVCGAGSCQVVGGTATCVSDAVCDGTVAWPCDGTDAVECDGTTEIGRVACGDLLGDGTVAGSCYDFGGSVEAWCVLPEGTRCLFPNGISMACGVGGVPSTTMGCDVVEGCVTGLSVCTPSSSFASYCVGAYLVWACVDFASVAQPVTIDCAAADWGAGGCSGTRDACEHSTTGGYCDDERVFCGGGLTCANKDASGIGECGPS